MGGTATSVGPVGVSGSDWLDKGTRALVGSPLPLPALVLRDVFVTLSVAKAAMDARRKASSLVAATALEARYSIFLQVEPLDIDANLRRARKMSPMQFYDAVRSYGEWDFKRREEYLAVTKKKAELNDLLQKFGNFFFGLVCAARGLNLYITTLGAGAYQVTSQSRVRQTGSPLDFAVGSVFLLVTMTADSLAASLPGGHMAMSLSNIDFTNAGARMLIGSSEWAMGDNPGDAQAIMEGWDFFFQRNGLAPPG